jgi:hypothetical protein
MVFCLWVRLQGWCQCLLTWVSLALCLCFFCNMENTKVTGKMTGSFLKPLLFLVIFIIVFIFNDSAKSWLNHFSKKCLLMLHQMSANEQNSLKFHFKIRREAKWTFFLFSLKRYGIFDYLILYAIISRVYRLKQWQWWAMKESWKVRNVGRFFNS